MQHDDLDLAYSGADHDSLTVYQHTLSDLQCYIGDPVAGAEQARTASPAFVMAHVLHGYLHALSTEPAAMPVVEADHRQALELSTNDRECGHVAALGHLAKGRWHDAGRALEDVAIAYPRDALALQIGHQIDFFTGESRMLRDRIARALPAWSASMPGYHSVLGMHAFGLEETGNYAAAEEAGRRAAALQPRDGWAQHAVAHVLEMQGRQRDGIAWIRANPDAWSTGSFFAVHNWWHLALYHLDLNDIDQVLAVFDGPIFGTPSAVALDMVDASALLWRLHLRGADVGDRWQAVASAWAPMAGGGNYAFNDAHAMMAFVGADRPELAAEVIQAQQRAMAGGGDNAMFTRDVGAPVTQAIAAFGQGRYAQVVELLRPVRNRAGRFGGSHAQRDLIDLTLIEAAHRDGQRALVRALASERRAVKPSDAMAAAYLRA